MRKLAAVLRRSKKLANKECEKKKVVGVEKPAFRRDEPVRQSDGEGPVEIKAIEGKDRGFG